LKWLKNKNNSVFFLTCTIYEIKFLVSLDEFYWNGVGLWLPLYYSSFELRSATPKTRYPSPHVSEKPAVSCGHWVFSPAEETRLGLLAVFLVWQNWNSDYLSHSVFFIFCFCFFETGSHEGLVQMSLEFTILLPQPPECWDYRCASSVPSHPLLFLNHCSTACHGKTCLPLKKFL
jgi:hypothetical protein